MSSLMMLLPVITLLSSAIAAPSSYVENQELQIDGVQLNLTIDIGVIGKPGHTAVLNQSHGAASQRFHPIQMLLLPEIAQASSVIAAPVSKNTISLHSQEPVVNTNYLSNADVQILNVNLNEVIDIAWVSEPGHNVILFERNGAAHQMLKLIPVSRASFRILNPDTGLYLQSLPGSVMIHIGSESTHLRSLWTFVVVGTNTYTIQNAENKLYMDTVNGGEFNLAVLRQGNGGVSQRWRPLLKN